MGYKAISAIMEGFVQQSEKCLFIHFIFILNFNNIIDVYTDGEYLRKIGEDGLYGPT